MTKSIRDKEMELHNKWTYLKELAKDDKIKRKTVFELYEAEDQLFKKWKFFKGYLEAKENNKDEQDKRHTNKNTYH
jgi:hypothetical protein